MRLRAARQEAHLDGELSSTLLNANIRGIALLRHTAW